MVQAIAQFTSSEQSHNPITFHESDGEALRTNDYHEHPADPDGERTGLKTTAYSNGVLVVGRLADKSVINIFWEIGTQVVMDDCPSVRGPLLGVAGELAVIRRDSGDIDYVPLQSLMHALPEGGPITRNIHDAASWNLTGSLDAAARLAEKIGPGGSERIGGKLSDAARKHVAELDAEVVEKCAMIWGPVG